MYYDKLQLFFKNKGLKQKEIAEQLGYSPAMISRYLKGSDKVNADFIMVLLKKFPEIDLQYIFSDDDRPLKPGAETDLQHNKRTKETIAELEEIEKKLSSIRKDLAQSCHIK